MNEVLERLKGKSAETILRESYQMNNIRVDLDVIFETYGIKRIPMTFEDIEEKYLQKGLGDVAGLIVLSGNDVGIFYKRTDSITQKRFTIAHELGHCCLHSDIVEDGYIEFRDCPTSSDKIEKEADSFANELLMPEQQIRYILKRLLKPSLRALATIFQVRVSVMRKRLIHLGISFYDDVDNCAKQMYNLIGY